MTSGTTQIQTTDDNWVPVGAIGSGDRYLIIINESALPGWFDFSDGVERRLPGGAVATTVPLPTPINATLRVKRVASGSNLTGVYAYTL